MPSIPSFYSSSLSSISSPNLSSHLPANTIITMTSTILYRYHGFLQLSSPSLLSHLTPTDPFALATMDADISLPGPLDNMDGQEEADLTQLRISPYIPRLLTWQAIYLFSALPARPLLDRPCSLQSSLATRELRVELVTPAGPETTRCCWEGPFYMSRPSHWPLRRACQIASASHGLGLQDRVQRLDCRAGASLGLAGGCLEGFWSVFRGEDGEGPWLFLPSASSRTSSPFPLTTVEKCGQCHLMNIFISAIRRSELWLFFFWSNDALNDVETLRQEVQELMDGAAKVLDDPDCGLREWRTQMETHMGQLVNWVAMELGVRCIRAVIVIMRVACHVHGVHVMMGT
ncbi:hypothetical protein L249_6145 [Ophiocordyceps polyrhachis-furcata BCC 54312]|uniref:Uncharacterized protein n=1 Tax=Ophiocordyceps polyrhachis-furcata BCC 54312 TaxID=1330021 RepID=A0A367LJ93_9HYPO|nr:hypothetical protein L249_6145 [Ophiocordyceps polyrhachis-furcata BCC 54312]